MGGSCRRYNSVGGILGGMTAGTFCGLMADASESQLSCGGVVVGGSAITVGCWC